MIVATAGHVDHGKTALIKQLTGEDTDKLAEEKRRGLTINLGFAFLDLTEDQAEQSSRIGFIDVPGHRRFINTMIAGVTGINMAMLVVAANEGPKPQTLEHLEVLRLLGVRDIVVVLTFADLVESRQLEQTKSSIQSLFDKLKLSQPLLFEVSNKTGSGIAALKSYLRTSTAQQQSSSRQQFFRLSIDRSFSLRGTGLVVTGTVRSGEVTVGDQLTVSPHDRVARVRSIHAENRERTSASTGQRCALNLVCDLSATDIERGDSLHARELKISTSLLDVQLEKSTDLTHELRHMLPVKLYVGAKKLAAKLVLAPNQLGKRLLGEQAGFAQLVLATPVSSLHGDRFLLRDDSEEILLGGGTVINPFAEQSRSMGAAWRKNLQALSDESMARVLTSLLLDLHNEVNVSQLCQARNMPQLLCLTFLEANPLNDKIKRFSNKDELFLVATEVFDQTVQRILDQVKAWHKLHAQEDGIPVGKLKELLYEPQTNSPSQELFLAAVGELIQSDAIVLRGGLISIVGRAVALTQEQTAIWIAVRDNLGKVSPAIPTVRELHDATGVDLKILSHTLDFLVRKNYLFRVSERRYALASTLLSFGKVVNDMEAKSEPIEVKIFKQRAGIGRNLCVEVLEYFDTIRFTQRRDSYRVVLDRQLPVKLFAKESL